MESFQDSKFLTRIGVSEDVCKEAGLAHAKTGYENGQAIIRFVDGKRGYVGGAATACIGFVLQALSRYAQLPTETKQCFEGHPLLIFALQCLCILSLLAGAVALFNCALTLIARGPKSDCGDRRTILFPFFDGTPDDATKCANVRYGMTREDIAKEYEVQLLNVGSILKRKVRRNVWAIIAVLTQLLLIVASGVVVTFCVC